jgi:hypothetical protein
MPPSGKELHMRDNRTIVAVCQKSLAAFPVLATKVALPVPAVKTAFPVLVVAFMASIFAPTADAAIVTVGHDLSTTTTFQADGTAYNQSVILNNGVLPTSPDAFSYEKVLDPDVLFTTAVITNLDGETSPIRLSNVIYQQFSTDSGQVFNDNTKLYTDAMYNGTTIRGLLAGIDGELFTSDDVEVLGAANQAADAILIYDNGSFFDDTSANRTYFGNEVEFEVSSQYTIVRDTPGPNLGGKMFTSAVIPEPGTFALLSIGTVLLTLRRRAL